MEYVSDNGSQFISSKTNRRLYENANKVIVTGIGCYDSSFPKIYKSDDRF